MSLISTTPMTPEQMWKTYRPQTCAHFDCSFWYERNPDSLNSTEQAVLTHKDGATDRLTHFPVTEKMLADVNYDIWATFREKIVSLHLQPKPEEGAYVYE
jgi:hypothetical protein